MQYHTEGNEKRFFKINWTFYTELKGVRNKNFTSHKNCKAV